LAIVSAVILSSKVTIKIARTYFARLLVITGKLNNAASTRFLSTQYNYPNTHE